MRADTKLLKLCKKKHFLLSTPPIPPGHEEGSKTQELISQAKLKIELTCGAHFSTGTTSNARFENPRRWNLGTSCVLGSSQQGQPLGADALIDKETLGLTQDEAGGDAWVYPFTQYANATKYGVLIMAITLENFRLWAGSEVCLKEISNIPDGRLFAYIEHTAEDAGGSQGYIVRVQAQEGTASATADNGKGYMVFANGSFYHGDLVNGYPNGQGIYTYASGDVYEGEWLDGKRHGVGKKKYSDGAVYLGEHKYGKKHGVGICTYAEGDVYEGEWEDLRHGRGTYKYADGRVYKGEWKDGKRHGQGKYTYTNGDVYEGEWKYDMRHGRGTKRYAKGVYEGEWKDDKKNGQGTYTYANGDLYEGEWKYDKRHGLGAKRYENGVYEGEWKNDKKNGRGKYTYANGTVYKGEWKHDKKNGQGTYIWADGAVYEGEWEDNNEVRVIKTGDDGNRNDDQDDSNLISQVKSMTLLLACECDVFISARFLGDSTQEQAKTLYEELLQLGVKVFMVSTNAGDNFGKQVMAALYHSKTLIAFCSSNYGALTASAYSTYHELEYANEQKKRILPVKLCIEWPPQPTNSDGTPNEEGTIQNKFVFKQSMAYLDWSDREWDAAECAQEIKEAME